MDLLALALQIAFLALAFGLRTYLHWRSTGNTGFRAGAQRTKAEAVGAGGITVATVASLVATLLSVYDAADPLPFLDIAALRWAGGIVATTGIVLVLAAQSNMGASWRIGVDTSETTELVTGGLFAYTRNPIFLGMLIFWLGMAFLVPNVLSIAAFVIALISVEVQVRLVEEPYLLGMHGASYQRYAGRTGRLVPGLGKLRAAAERPGA